MLFWLESSGIPLEWCPPIWEVGVIIIRVGGLCTLWLTYGCVCVRSMWAFSSCNWKLLEVRLLCIIIGMVAILFAATFIAIPCIELFIVPVWLIRASLRLAALGGSGLVFSDSIRSLSICLFSFCFYSFLNTASFSCCTLHLSNFWIMLLSSDRSRYCYSTLFYAWLSSWSISSLKRTKCGWITGL